MIRANTHRRIVLALSAALASEALLGIPGPSASNRVIGDGILQLTYIGGADPDSANAVTTDPATGDVIVGGQSYSNEGQGVDGFVARFDPTLRTLLQFAYVGGSGGDEILAVAVHPATGDVYVAGVTGSSDFPGAAGGAQPEKSGLSDGFVARLDPTLSRVLGATFLGGSHDDQILAIAIHPLNGDVYVGGYTTSDDLPGVAGGGQTTLHGDFDGFVARFDPTLATRVQTTYFGGQGFPGQEADYIRALAIHPSNGEILAIGQTLTGDLPAADGGAQGQNDNGDWDAFVVRIDPALTRFLQSTYLGGIGIEDARGIAVDPRNGEILVTGSTNGGNFPVSQDAAQTAAGAENDAYVARFDATLTHLLRATYFGGGGDDFGSGIVVEPASGDVTIAGVTFSNDLPGTAGGAQSSKREGTDGFIARFDANLGRLLQSTYLGGSGDDAVSGLALAQDGGVLVAGGTTSPDMPRAREGAQPGYGGGDDVFGGDGFVSRLSPNFACVSSPDEPCLNNREPEPVGTTHSPRSVTRPF